MVYLNKKNCIAVKPLNGLANRIRVLCSYKILAEYIEYPYFIYWCKTNGFDDTKLNDLFADIEQNFNCEIIDGNDYKDIRPNSFQIDKHISGTNERGVKDNQNHLKESYTRLILNKTFKKLSVEASNLLVWSMGYSFQQKVPDFKMKYKKNLRNLIVSDAICNKAKQTYDKFECDVIGVHIRKGDSLDNRNPKRKIHEKFDQTELYSILAKTKKQVFLCTDDESSLDFFKDKLGDQLVYRKKDFQISKYDKEKLGQIDAMVDLHLLSKTSCIIPTSPSSFSKLASDIGGELYSKYSYQKLSIHNQFSDVIYW